MWRAPQGTTPNTSRVEIVKTCRKCKEVGRRAWKRLSSVKLSRAGHDQGREHTQQGASNRVEEDEIILLDCFTPVISSWSLGITGKPWLSLSKGSHTGLLCFCCFMAFSQPQCWQPWLFLKLCCFKPCVWACLKVNVYIWVLGCQNDWVAVDLIFIAWSLQQEVCRITHHHLCGLAVWYHTMLVATCAALRSIQMTRAMIKAGNATIKWVDKDLLREAAVLPRISTDIYCQKV
jgi:hypothetical protein